MLGGQKRIADRFAERLVIFTVLRRSHITIILPEEVKDTFFSPKLKFQLLQFLLRITEASQRLNAVDDLAAADIYSRHGILMLQFVFQRRKSR
ncbi:hypothetical protein D3C85_1604230 [compost metagenome]